MHRIHLMSMIEPSLENPRNHEGNHIATQLTNHIYCEQIFNCNYPLINITSPLGILNLNNSIESYDSKLRCPSCWDTLYSNMILLLFLAVLFCVGFYCLYRPPFSLLQLHHIQICVGKARWSMQQLIHLMSMIASGKSETMKEIIQQHN